MNRKIKRLDGMTSILVYEDDMALFLVAPSVEIADKLVEVWNRDS